MRIGIIGAGQLGQMLGEAARELGYECLFVDPAENPPAASEGEVIRAAFDDASALRELVDRSDVITYEFENVPVEALQDLGTAIPVYPPTDALRHGQDRLHEKQLFESLEIDLPPYRPVDSLEALRHAATELGLPLVLKTRRFGYDGKGQVVLRTRDEVAAAWKKLGEHALIAEAFVPFDYEVSVIGVRNVAGNVRTWPLTHNEHEDGILRCSRAPVENTALDARARDYMQRLLEHLNYVGVLALELFVAGDRLLANEYAPRVHNSGHWTIEAAETSQFANHLLAIAGENPRATNCRGYAGMVNLIGEISPESRRLDTNRFHLHDYGKTARPGRKLGHITVLADSAEQRDALVAEARQTVT